MITASAALGVALEDLLHQATDGLFLIDHQKRCVFFSTGCEQIAGCGGECFVGNGCTCEDTRSCDNDYGRRLSGLLCRAACLLDGTSPKCRQALTIRRPDGRSASVDATYTPLRDSGGRVTHVLGVIRDVEFAHDTRIFWSPSPREVPPDSLAPEEQGENGEASPNLAHGLSLHAGARIIKRAEQPLDRYLGRIERDEIVDALRIANGQRAAAAKLLGISRSRLYRRIEALGIPSGSDDTVAASNS
jgi:PAS domain S-box-containing protein